MLCPLSLQRKLSCLILACSLLKFLFFQKIQRKLYDPFLQIYLLREPEKAKFSLETNVKITFTKRVEIKNISENSEPHVFRD